MGKLKYEELTYKIRGAFFEVYNILGTGLKELIYHNALKEEFNRLNIKCEEKKRISIIYKERTVGIYEPDFIIDDKIIIEIKSVPSLIKIYEKQLYNYLKGTNYTVGFLVNFGADKLEIKRRVCG